MDRPNVLLICADTWSGGMIGALGHPTVLTPTLDQLVANGIAFTNATSTTPMCIPARREIMTGVSARTHGDRAFAERGFMPQLPTLAQTFRDNGYQAHAVGKMHAYPQRDRLGFDDIQIDEEGRHHLGMDKDDYEMFLQEHGHAGQEFVHGSANGDFEPRPWHLPERLHRTNWTAFEMSKYIARRDPSKPGFWYMSFSAAHPPLTPLSGYMDMYLSGDIDEPVIGEWARHPENWPHALRNRPHGIDSYSPNATRLARAAYYGLITHVDHQIRLVIGLLKEEGLLDNTIIMFTTDHGEMLGNHGLWVKGNLHQFSIDIPMILMPQANREDLAPGRLDERLAVQADIMPTLLELAGIPTPDHIEGKSLVGDDTRDHVYGEIWEDDNASRMVRERQFKLIYFPVGNRSQMFDLLEDPLEMNDLSDDPNHSAEKARLTDLLTSQLYGADLEWIKDGSLVGLPDAEAVPHPNPKRGFGNPRGWRF